MSDYNTGDSKRVHVVNETVWNELNSLKEILPQSGLLSVKNISHDSENTLKFLNIFQRNG